MTPTPNLERMEAVARIIDPGFDDDPTCLCHGCKLSRDSSREFILAKAAQIIALQDSDLRTMAEERDRFVEAAAKAIYEQWSYRPGYVRWVPFGNSTMQDVARQISRAALSGLRLSEGGGRISSSSDAQSDAPSAPVTNAAGLLP